MKITAQKFRPTLHAPRASGGCSNNLVEIIHLHSAGHVLSVSERLSLDIAAAWQWFMNLLAGWLCAMTFPGDGSKHSPCFKNDVDLVFKLADDHKDKSRYVTSGLCPEYPFEGNVGKSNHRNLTELVPTCQCVPFIYNF